MSDAAASASAPRRTPCYDNHVALGARIIDFGGWAMPVQYKTGILDEHKAVRERCGLFDVSHMGEVFIRGPRAAEAVQRVTTADISKLVDGQAVYNCTCREDGGIVDDLIVYRWSQEVFMIIVNASTCEKDFAHFVKHAGAIADWKNESDDFGLLSIQGPNAIKLVASLTGGRVPPRAFTFLTDVAIDGMPGRYFVSRTGYTGEDGVEIMAPTGETARLWDLLVERGSAPEFGLAPIGLGARDTLRLEARLSLYGNDIDEDHNPIEAGLGWVVKGHGYVGEGPVEATRKEGAKRKLVGFKAIGRGTPRHGYPVHALDGETPGAAIGVVTSGTVAPTVGGSVGMAWVPAEYATPGTRLSVDCRGKHAVVELVKGPFYTRPTQG